MYIIYAILAFGLLIIVHELGHFILAKINGVRVEEFSIGMGPKIFSVDGKETKYSLGILPIGGYVKMLGEEEDVNDERSFSAKSPLRRITIILAGAFMNLILAIVIFTAYLNHFGYRLPKVQSVIDKSPAYEAGIKPGDKFEKINGSKVFTADDMTFAIALSKGNPVNIEVNRDGKLLDFNVKPSYNEKEKRDMIGFSFDAVKNPTIVQSFKESFNQTGSLIKQTFQGLKMIFTGKADLKTDVGGPVTIIKLSGQAAKAGIWTLLYFTAFISINLAVFNLLPFPALDGGWTVLLLIELITRRKVPDKVAGALNFVGFALLMGLMLLVTVKDILFPIKF
ncbi:RIP metalloprotease RseP [Clostridium baratii]|uniref:Zinc metalloprotease n=1 Tax=Clostridium baratii TaxID=1561 RepID=A0A174QG19_9CLOT|nr:RIP metalloprotease RseP [Clostridium baratii]OPF51720.1 RIP metalloprotease RseP [Clostridium baratii]OPF53365.1 RIP metalloprotease RseP [Clostridium baratii]OPF57490.1 RIP metalloprotease RseP [Clostridium baratii]OPF60412.1 RIP metalloprotease RseP [Clostridium baratii]CUP69665.1 membrane-associated zinc metalloprotease [Clostridium baratii]